MEWQKGPYDVWGCGKRANPTVQQDRAGCMWVMSGMIQVRYGVNYYDASTYAACM